MKRLGFAAAVLVTCWFSVSMGQQVKEPESADDRFLATFEVGQLVRFEEWKPKQLEILKPAEGVSLEEHRKAMNAVMKSGTIFDVSRVGKDYIEISQDSTKFRLPVGTFYLVERKPDTFHRFKFQWGSSSKKSAERD